MYSTPIFPHKYWQGKLIESKYCKSFWTLKDWAISSPFCGSASGKAPRAANMSSRIFSSATFGYYLRSSCFTCYRRYRQAGEMGLWYDMAEKRPADSEPVSTFLLFIYCTIHNLEFVAFTYLNDITYHRKWSVPWTESMSIRVHSPLTYIRRELFSPGNGYTTHYWTFQSMEELTKLQGWIHLLSTVYPII